MPEKADKPLRQASFEHFGQPCFSHPAYCCHTSSDEGSVFSPWHAAFLSDTLFGFSPPAALLFVPHCCFIPSFLCEIAEQMHVRKPWAVAYLIKTNHAVSRRLALTQRSTQKTITSQILKSNIYFKASEKKTPSHPHCLRHSCSHTF